MARTNSAELLARIAKLEALLVEAAPVAAASAHFSARDIPCSADKPCSRTFRTAKRAAVHGVDKGGHEPR
jgi:hypothetical protein